MPGKIVRKKRGTLSCAYCQNFNEGFCINWHINIKDDELPCQAFKETDF